MNPLTRALKLADDPQPEDAARTADQSPGSVVRDRGRLGPIRATRDDPAAETLSPTVPAGDDASGREAPGGVRFAPIRATRDDPVAQSRPPTALAVGGVPGRESPGGAPPARMRATRDGAIAHAAIPGGDPAAPEMPAPIPAALADSPSDPTDAAANDEAAARAVDRRDFRTLRRGGGVGRGIGIALSLLAVTGAAAGGGTFLWKTELARPALVGSLPSPAPVVMVPTPPPGANAAGGGATEPAGNGTPPSKGSPAVLPAAPRNGGVPAPSTAPGDEGHPVGSTAESVAPMPESSFSGLRAPGAPEVARRIGTEHAAPAAERSDAEPPPDAGGRIAIRKRKRPDHVAASLERAWEAYLAGDGEAAGQAYRAVLEHEPRNRDARLGLAAVATRAGRWGEAAEHYATLLASHPADTAARAALVAIGEKDPARAESRLKALLRIEPQAAHLHFSLGNLYAAQSRWPEAQQSWFSAYRLDRGNADHAYNLAVGLDHLSQSRNALDLYREALVLARSSPASFQAETVLKRIRALKLRPDAERVPDGTDPDEAAAAAAAHVR